MSKALCIWRFSDDLSAKLSAISCYVRYRNVNDAKSAKASSNTIHGRLEAQIFTFRFLCTVTSRESVTSPSLSPWNSSSLSINKHTVTLSKAASLVSKAHMLNVLSLYHVLTSFRLRIAYHRVLDADLHILWLMWVEVVERRRRARLGQTSIHG